MSCQVKICGVNDKAAIQACSDSGASYAGFVFVEKSPRFLTVDHAADMSGGFPDTLRKVGLFCDPSIDDIRRVLSRVSLDMVQLHGSETMAFCQQVRQAFDVKVMKAVGVSSVEEVEAARVYEDVCDWLLFDAKPISGSLCTGGHGLSFDWSILQGQKFVVPWMLAGGLTSENVSEAIERLNPKAVDVSSGVERERGVKDLKKIQEFCSVVRGS